MIKKIIKRDGSTVLFNSNKITEAIFKAGKSRFGESFLHNEAEKLSSKVVEILEKKYPNKIPTVEQTQDIVEITLMAQNDERYHQVAKTYILYREEHSKIRQIQEDIMEGKSTRLPFTENSLRVIAGRYLKRDGKTGKIVENPEEMFDRVAKSLANVEKRYGKNADDIKKIEKDFRDILYNFEFTPAGRTLANAGSDTKLVANCIVLHMEDSMEGIFQTLKEAALLQQAGSGLGFPFHLLRPAGQRTIRNKGVSSGPVSFLKVYNEAFGIIKQQGRHGANMAVMSIDHPDILDFVQAKRVEGDLRNFNISVGITDKFMKEVVSNSDKPWICEFGGVKMKPRTIIRDKYGNVSDIKESTMTAREIFDEIVSAAWSNGEPGVVFLDEANRKNPVPKLGRIEACNPCGEQFLQDGDVCNLGSINLEMFAKDGKLDEERLKEVTRISVRLLDNVIDLSEYPSERVNKTFRGNRRIGLGIMGFADLLYMLNIRYDSDKGFQMASKVMKLINDEAHAESQRLAKEKGVFPNYDLSIYKEKNIKMRNAALTTVAPTGSISMIYDVSSGVEPYFALSYYKEVMGGQKLYYLNKHLEKVLRERNLYTHDLIEKISEEGSLQNIKGIPQDIKDTFVVAMDISAESHIRMQAAFQKYTDNAISKTCNFPNSATKDDVMQGYILAWQLKCKGCTVYRDGSRDVQVLNLLKNDEGKEVKRENKKFEETMPENNRCPECNQKMELKEGCATCPSCGYSYCSV